MAFVSIAVVTILVGMLVSGWIVKGTMAKVVFTIMTIPLGLYGILGAWHAWGESQSLPWAAGWLAVTVLCFWLATLRCRRP